MITGLGTTVTETLVVIETPSSILSFPWTNSLSSLTTNGNTEESSTQIVPTTSVDTSSVTVPWTGTHTLTQTTLSVVTYEGTTSSEEVVIVETSTSGKSSSTVVETNSVVVTETICPICTQYSSTWTTTIVKGVTTTVCGEVHVSTDSAGEPVTTLVHSTPTEGNTVTFVTTDFIGLTVTVCGIESSSSDISGNLSVVTVTVSTVSTVCESSEYNNIHKPEEQTSTGEQPGGQTTVVASSEAESSAAEKATSESSNSEQNQLSEETTVVYVTTTTGSQGSNIETYQATESVPNAAGSTLVSTYISSSVANQESLSVSADISAFEGGSSTTRFSLTIIIGVIALAMV